MPRITHATGSPSVAITELIQSVWKNGDSFAIQSGRANKAGKGDDESFETILLAHSQQRLKTVAKGFQVQILSQQCRASVTGTDADRTAMFATLFSANPIFVDELKHEDRFEIDS
jgi:hypothetical protein